MMSRVFLDTGDTPGKEQTDTIKSTAMTQPVVKAEKLTKVFRDFWCRSKVRAVNRIDFEVHSGEVFGLLGPNGSGKTTILKMIMGLLNPSEGRLLVLGLPPHHVKSKSRIGYLPEESWLYPFLTPQEILTFYGRLFDLSGHERRNHMEQLLEMMGLQHARRRPVGEFSKGMARRIGLAQALINDPDLIVLDEPTSGLDPVGCRQVKDLIQTLARRGKTVILASHLLADVENICHRVAILCDGSIIIQGGVRDLLEQRDSYRLTFPSLSHDSLEKMLSMVRQETGMAPDVDHPSQTLEQFFLKAIADIVPTSTRPTGATPTEGVADYLSKDAGAGMRHRKDVANNQEASTTGEGQHE